MTDELGRGSLAAVAVQRHLGHKDISTTLNICGHLWPDRQDALAGALDAVHEAAPGRVEDVS